MEKECLQPEKQILTLTQAAGETVAITPSGVQYTVNRFFVKSENVMSLAFEPGV